MNQGFFLAIRTGFYSLLLHKMRSALAILGILIGITAVIWLVALGEGVSYQAQEQIKDLGARNVIVRSVKPAQQTTAGGGGRGGFFLEYGLLRADYRRILTNVPYITQAVPIRQLRKEVRANDRTVEARIVGCPPEYFALNRLQAEQGRLLESRDGNPPQNVAVIASDVGAKLFAFKDPLGQAIQIENDFYRIVGQTSPRDPTAAIGGSLDSQAFNLDVYIPLETLRWRIGDMVSTSRVGSREGEIVELSQITLSVQDIAQVDDTADIIRVLMDKYHPKQDVGIVVPKELLRQAELLRMLFNVLLILIAGISLVVGGIGIMNIMLATVSERTREIGIRRALGARRRDIIHQFLVESMVLTSIGGTLGVLFGFLCHPTVAVVRLLAERFFTETVAAIPPTIRDLEPRIAPWSIVASLLISIGVGLIFGLYPAYRAAHMDPIEALRHE